ncbi:MAG: methylenetetrahydrofolate reductase [Eubacteriales bacterium]
MISNIKNQNIVKRVRENIVSTKDDIVIKKSAFYEKLQSKQKTIAVELDSPFNTQIQDFMAGAKVLQDAGVDIITIADCPVARARMDSSLLACKVKRELGIDTMPHMTCRDRNNNASKALLLGLNIEDINNVLIITGDPIPTEQRSEVKAVYEFNSRMLLKHITNLNKTLFDNPFYLYAALNINATNFHVQLRLAKEKKKKGACAFFTQPVLSEKALENLKIAQEELNSPIFGGILPIVSYRNACFINNEIPGINVCHEIIELYKDKTREECHALAIKISCEIAKKMEPFIDGYYVITPFKNVELIKRIVESIKDIRT